MGLNLVVELYEMGILEEFNVEIFGIKLLVIE